MAETLLVTARGPVRRSLTIRSRRSARLSADLIEPGAVPDLDVLRAYEAR
jgi:hypothetical protein